MKYCSNCKHNSYDRERKEYFCNNKKSESYGLETAYDDCCEDYELKVKTLGYTLNKLGKGT